METTTITPRELFALGQVLTIARANALKGKTIAVTHPVYSGNQNTVEVITVGDVLSHWDYAATQPYANDKYPNRQAHWRSYMSEEQINIYKGRMLLLNAAGESTYIVAHMNENNCFGGRDVFTCSDADREVYYCEIKPQSAGENNIEDVKRESHLQDQLPVADLQVIESQSLPDSAKYPLLNQPYTRPQMSLLRWWKRSTDARLHNTVS